MDLFVHEQARLAISDQLFESTWRAVYPELKLRATRRAKGNSEYAQEYLSATAIKALLFFRRSRDLIKEPHGFMFLVLDHVFLDSVRSKKREARVFDYSVDLDRSEHQVMLACTAVSVLKRTELYERLVKIDQQVSKLPPMQQRLFEMRFVDDLPYPQIAAELGIPQPLVRKRVQLLRDALR